MYLIYHFVNINYLTYDFFLSKYDRVGVSILVFLLLCVAAVLIAPFSQLILVLLFAPIGMSVSLLCEIPLVYNIRYNHNIAGSLFRWWLARTFNVGVLPHFPFGMKSG